jgi:phosphoserine aminotransferase
LLLKPTARPSRPHFSSGPCPKPPGWSLDRLDTRSLGRSHRSSLGKARLAEAIDRTAALLGLPAGYRLGIVPASDTGAMEMAMWSLLGQRPVTMLAWESFGEGWITDVTKQLKLPDVRVFKAPYGELPDLRQVDTDRDVVFTWNGTTSGVRVPDGDWIKPDRKGLTICDATSAAFAMKLPWDKLDVVTWSWQKVLGGEAAHGMLVLSPRAVERLESYKPAWPLPKIFRMTSGGKLSEGIFKGDTINTPSMIAVEDQIDALRWAESIGGLPALIARSEGNLAALTPWVERSDWIAFLAKRPEIRSCTSVCFVVKAPFFAKLSPELQAEASKKIASIVEKEGIAYDVAPYRDAPPGLRVWCGATIETSDIEKLTPWLDWAFDQVRREYEPKVA